METSLHGYLALGDSYTIGEGVAANAHWPDRLVQLLADAGLELGRPKIIAQTGWTCAELAAAITAEQPPGHWRLVSLLIGVNDQYRGYPLAEYGPRFAQLLEQAITLTDGRPQHVLVLSIPDWGVTPFARSGGHDPARIAAQIDCYNAIARAQAAARGTAFLDITAVSRAHGSDDAMLADDGLHPGAAMHALWASAALPVVRAMLSKQTR
ncbi:MAG: lysophospholipase [Gammaproteobacteria bacterium HGW-Gammaproteobacteria-4]|jgi:lysophospholipase L1-like esterase|nr:MAG: lysophospholipase [Gammaproteobacteria bacterium HGW-Gammaproteobacteria-4]